MSRYELHQLRALLPWALHLLVSGGVGSEALAQDGIPFESWQASTIALGPPSAGADTASFAEAWTTATTVESLGRFLEDLLGDCDGSPGSVSSSAVRACREEAEKARAAAKGRLFALTRRDVKGKLDGLVWVPSKNAYRVFLTPIFGELGLGLTIGRPTRLNRAGQPVLARRRIWLRRPEGVPEFIFRRDLERGMVLVDLLVEVGRPWRLGRRGQKSVRGLSAKLRGLRVRTRDAVLTEKLYGR